MKFFGVFISLLLASFVTTGFAPREERFSPERFLREREELVFDREIEVGYGTVYQFRQRYRGMEVYGASCSVATDRSGKVLSVNDRTVPLTGTLPDKISLQSARERAAEYGGEILSYEKIVYGRENPEICYDFKTTAQGGSEILISAADGTPVGTFPKLSFATVSLPLKNFDGEEVILPVEKDDVYYLADGVRNIYVYNAENRNSGPMPIYSSPDGNFRDPMAVSVYENVVKAYDFYADEKNVGVSWKGINGKNDEIEENTDSNGEVPLIVLVHYDNRYENANCGYFPETGEAVMYVGDGWSKGTLYQQGRAADVIAHEYQHAVSDFRAGGGRGIYYQNESGAISEAVSDIFGSLIEGWDLTDESFWTVGEDAVAKEGDIVRSMKRPSDGYAMHLSDEAPLCYENHDHYTGYCDNGNAHANSTILTHIQYRMWQKMPEYFTRERIGTLWFATIPMLSYYSDFEEFAAQMVAAAKNLNFDEQAQKVVSEAFFESGFFEEKNTHLVTFREDGTVIEKITVRDGADASSFSLPDISLDSGTYCFRGWDRDLTQVTGDLVVNAKFEMVLNEYQVRFLSEGNLIANVVVKHGFSADPPKEIPEKPSDERCDYVFDHWDQSLDGITSDLTVNAVFREVLHSFSVHFVSEGVEIATDTVEYGSACTPPKESPVKESSQEYDYLFVGWDGDLSQITAETTFFAVFEPKLRKYHVVYMDGEQITSEGIWNYGDTPSLLPPLNVKNFDGWYLDPECKRSAEGVVVTGDLTLYAKRKSSIVWILIGVGAGVAVIGAATFLVIRKRRRQ